MFNLFAIFLFLASSIAMDAGILEFDESAFNKLIGRGVHDVLVVFTEFGWKLPTDFAQVGEAFADNNDVLVAKLDVSSVADGSALKLSTDELPSVRFYPKNGGDPAVFTGDAEQPEAVVDFVHGELSPQLQQLKGLAQKFIHGAETVRSASLKSAEKIASGLGDAYTRLGKFYTVFMKRILEKGDAWVETEKQRLTGLLASSSVTPAKKVDFRQRLGVLTAFVKKAVGGGKAEL